jgi:hypothetical protein
MHEALVEVLANRFSGSTEVDGVNNAVAWPETQAAYRLLADRYIAATTDLTLLGTGRGIVTCAGGIKYLPSVWVMLKRLRDLGCTLPVEMWHLGDAEVDPAMRKLLAGLGVRCRDAEELVAAHGIRILRGWELKSWALLCSDFAEALFIDADNAPVIDPTYLFDDPRYLIEGTIFWPDFPHWTLRAEVYAVFGCQPPGPSRPSTNDFSMFDKEIDESAGWDVPVESGQLLVNRARCSRELSLAAHFCNHSDYYFRFVHGDKEAFHLAWRRLGSTYAMPMRWPGWSEPTMKQYDFDGRIAFAHRTWSKWTLGKNPFPTDVPGEAERHAAIAELKRVWTGMLWVNGNPSSAERIQIDQLGDRKFFYHRVGHDARILELKANRTIGQGSSDNERRWDIFDVDGSPTLVISGASGPTCFLKRDIEKWRGRCVINEKMPIELVPLS